MNTGGGGGAGSTTSGNGGSGGSGGSGYIAIRFNGAMPQVSAGLTYSTIEDAGLTYIFFTAGTGTVTW